MRTKIFLRVAKTEGRKGYKVDATEKPNNTPLKTPGYRLGDVFHPTVAFALEVDIPDELFEQASKVVGQINLAMKDAQITSEIVVPAGVTIKQK